MNVGNSDQMQDYASQMRVRPPSTEDIFSKIMQETDIDGDGTISADEVSALEEQHQTRLLEADSDGNGLITEDELMTKIAEQIAAKGEMEGGKPMEAPTSEDIVNMLLETSDTDGDGSISTEELAALDEQGQQMLATADTDGDGIITETELSSQVAEEIASHDQGSMPPMQDMTVNAFKDMLATLVEADTQSSDNTAIQIQDYLGQLGLAEDEITGLMSLLENKRFDVRA